jgi:hypothetical protein
MPIPQTSLSWLAMPHGREVRRFLAGIGILMGLGRLLDYGLSATVQFGASQWYGWALLTGGVALLATARHRLTTRGRLGAVLAVFCFSFRAVGTWGNNAANLYGWCALACFAEALSRRNDDY